MPDTRLSALQRRVLEVLAELEPRWTLTGGAALAGFHLRHRTTRDLDLFWHGQTVLGDLANRVERLLSDDGLEVTRVETATSFARLRVLSEDGTTVVDLVAEPVPTVEAPVDVKLANTTIRIDGAHEILVNKLCALLSRAEIRDLIDVRALLAVGGEFDRALRDAPSKDGGFSPLTLAWVLQDLPIGKLASESEAGELERFRGELIARLVRSAVPDEA